MSGSRLFRIFSFLLSVLFLLPAFSVGVSAADEENIVSTDFREWTVFEGNVTLFKSGDYNTIICGPSNAGTASVPYCTVYDLTDGAVVGNKYQISFNFRNSDPYLGSGAGLIGSEAFLSYGGIMFVGLGSLTTLSNGEKFYNPVEGCYVQINKDNYSQMTDTLTEFSFEMPNGVINPCIMIYFICAVDTQEDINKSVHLTFKDFSAIDLTKSEEDGFFSRLFDWFEVKFKAIGDSFTDLKDSFVGKINDLKESFQNKIDELKQSFVDLKTDLIEGIKGLFVPDEAEISEWKLNLEILLSDNLGFIYQLPDLMSDLVIKLRDILVRDDFSFCIKLPQLDFKLFGHDAVLWEEKTVDFSYIFEEGVFKTLYGMYKVMLYVIFGFALVKYGWRVFEEMMQN